MYGRTDEIRVRLAETLAVPPGLGGAKGFVVMAGTWGVMEWVWGKTGAPGWRGVDTWPPRDFAGIYRGLDDGPFAVVKFDSVFVWTTADEAGSRQDDEPLPRNLEVAYTDRRVMDVPLRLLDVAD